MDSIAKDRGISNLTPSPKLDSDARASASLCSSTSTVEVSIMTI